MTPEEYQYRLAHPSTVRMYDAGIDDYRDVTQEDFDRLLERVTRRADALVEAV